MHSGFGMEPMLIFLIGMIAVIIIAPRIAAALGLIDKEKRKNDKR